MLTRALCMLILLSFCLADTCSNCETKELQIFAGQHHLSGAFTIVPVESSGSSTTFRVTAIGTNNWYWQLVHVYIDDSPPTKNSPGQFPYHFDNLDSQYFSQLITVSHSCDSTFYFAFHAESYQLVGGAKTNGQTSWADGEEPFGKAWGSYDSYPGCCPVEIDCGECTAPEQCGTANSACYVYECNSNKCELVENFEAEGCECVTVDECGETGSECYVYECINDECILVETPDAESCGECTTSDDCGTHPSDCLTYECFENDCILTDTGAEGCDECTTSDECNGSHSACSVYVCSFTQCLLVGDYDNSESECQPKELNIFAGQNYLSGSFSIVPVANSEEGTTTFRVTATGTNNWYWELVHIYIDDSAPTKNSPGQFPYHYYDVDSQSFSELITVSHSCDSTFYFAFHANSYQLVDGAKTNGQTSWADGEEPFGKAWGSYDSFPGCCTEAADCQCETADECGDSGSSCSAFECNENQCELVETSEAEGCECLTAEGCGETGSECSVYECINDKCVLTDSLNAPGCECVTAENCGTPDSACYVYECSNDKCVLNENADGPDCGCLTSDDCGTHPSDCLTYECFENDCILTDTGAEGCDECTTSDECNGSHSACSVYVCSFTQCLLVGGYDNSESECQPKELDIFAGQNYLSGSFSIVPVANSEEGTTTFRVTATGTNNWYWELVHIYIDDSAPTKNAPGQFPYHYYDVDSQSFSELITVSHSCDSTFYFAFHANSYQLVDGAKTNGQTSWADGEEPFGKAWGSYDSFPGCCTETVDCQCETADECGDSGSSCSAFECNENQCELVETRNAEGCECLTTEDCTGDTPGICSVYECANDKCVLVNNDDYSRETTCGLGPCTNTGLETCDGQKLADSCEPNLNYKTSNDDSDCDGYDDNCSGEADEGFKVQKTTCGTGNCASVGELICEDGAPKDTCEPGEKSEEICNGIDDNCNGFTDEGYTGKQTICGVGVCATTGETICEDGAERDTCTPLAPNSEDDSDCDGLDDNCNNQIDEDYIAETVDCGTGVCKRTITETCINGVKTECVPGDKTMEKDDNCNGIDEDCDGSADEDFEDEQIFCGLGVCRNEGTKTCQGGKIVDDCTENPKNSEDDANCDDNDDNCDGLLNEGHKAIPITCPNEEGTCENTGEYRCVNGEIENTCKIPRPTDATDICNGIDDNCDGEIDEDFEKFQSQEIECGTGYCANTGKTICDSGQIRDECEPKAKFSETDATCDGVDDNCNGRIDENFEPTESSCGFGVCARTVYTVCINGKEEGVCEPGEKELDSDTTCNNVDEDCDGLVDEDFVPTNTTCGMGICKQTGATYCEDGKIYDSCVAKIPDPDIEDNNCNNIDEDCDGEVDEHFEETESNCGGQAGVSVCATTGKFVCIAGNIVDTCTPFDPQAVDSTCNGIDEDCDNETDEHYVETETTCGVGACKRKGILQCVDGVEIDTCTPGVPALTDSNCDGIDDNCNGDVDDEYVPTDTSCGLGNCSSNGQNVCVDGTIVDTCKPETTTFTEDSVCDGQDEDCDGLVDEDVKILETTCGNGKCRNKGEERCIAGQMVDTCTFISTDANDNNCDGIDDNCSGKADDEYTPVVVSCGVGACFNTEGITSCVKGNEEIDCEPKAPLSLDDSTCDGIDDNCNGLVDEDALCNDGLACSIDSCTSNGVCDRDMTLCNAPCHKCDIVTQGIISIFDNTEIGKLSFHYDGGYVFRAEASDGWSFEEVHVIVTRDFVSYDTTGDITIDDFDYHYDASANPDYFEAKVDAPGNCGEDYGVSFLVYASRPNAETRVLGYAFGDTIPEGFIIPLVTMHRACCFPADCPVCVVNTDCVDFDNDPCSVHSCSLGDCVQTDSVCPGPVPETPDVPVEPVPEDPQPLPPPVAPEPNPDNPIQLQSSSTSGGQAAPAPVENEAEAVVVGTPSSLVMSAIGAGAVGFFAFFAVVVGLNNTKKDPEIPLDAVLADVESNQSAFINPTFNPVNGAMQNGAAI